MPYKSDTRPLTSIVSYPERGEGGNNRYRGNCSPRLIEDLLEFFQPRETVTTCAAAGRPKRRRTSWVLAVISMTCTAVLTS